MKVAIGADHGGFRLKEEIKQMFAQTKGHGPLGQVELTDVGTHSEDSVDYPDFGAKVACGVAAKDYDFGIIICGTGIGISIAANKVKGVRAALCHEPFSARMAREHNNANILALGERVTGPGLAQEIIHAFFTASFAGGRHQRRVDKIMALENESASVGRGS